MNEIYGYDPRGSHSPQSPKQPDREWLRWLGLAALFIFGLWPLGIIGVVQEIRRLARMPESRAHSRTDWAAQQLAREQAAKAARWEAVPQQKAAPQPEKKPEKKEKSAARGSGKALSIVGGCIAGVYAVASLALLGSAAFISSRVLLSLLFVFIGLMLGGLTMLAAGRGLSKRSRRFARYCAVLGDRDHVAVSELTGVVGKSAKTVARDLEAMVEKNMLGKGAYFDSGRGILFRSAEAAQRYLKQETQPVTPQEANEGYAGALRAIRYANDRIADPVLSEKIDHLETVAGCIFREIEQHPEKQAQASTFFSYYLPTTLKILNTYAEFDGAGIEGENLKRAKQKIEQTMDALVTGFDKQLDDLYRSEAMDIEGEIRVMENMLKRDVSSVEQDFGLGTAVQRRPDEE